MDQAHVWFVLLVLLVPLTAQQAAPVVLQIRIIPILEVLRLWIVQLVRLDRPLQLVLHPQVIV